MNLPRVTTIISVINNIHLNKWRGYVGNEEADKIMKEAGEFGKSFHSLVDCIHKAKEYKISNADEKIRPMIKNYEKWYNANIDKVIASELYLEHEKFGYCGTFDLVVKLKDEKELTLIDVKTSNSVYSTFGIQLSAYKNLYENNFNDKIDKAMIIRIDKKTHEIETKIYDSKILKKYYKIFLACLTIYKNNSLLK